MSMYTIGDLHLSFKENKPMSIFGDNWENHEEKIKKDWIEKVKAEDLVILPGDFSWATYLEDTDEDFKYLNELPGKKILLKGNHDYWWTTLKSMRRFIEENEFENIDFLYNNAYLYKNYILAGTRGWNQTEDQEDKRLFAREVLRLELSIKKGIEEFGEDKEIIIFTHYPPISKNKVLQHETNDMIEMMKKYNVKQCYYGHLHGASINDAFEGEYKGIDFKLVSADGLDFKLFKIL